MLYLLNPFNLCARKVCEGGTQIVICLKIATGVVFLDSRVSESLHRPISSRFLQRVLPANQAFSAAGRTKWAHETARLLFFRRVDF
jgi:hypothetical protein